jgi:hypothetical protein
VAETGSAEGDRVVVLDELATEVGEDGRAVRNNVATDRDVAASGELRTDRATGISSR